MEVWARLRKCGSGLVRLLIKGISLGAFASRKADSPKASNVLFFLNVKTSQIQNILIKHTITPQFNEGIFHNISFIFSFVGQLEVLSGRVHLLCYFNDESASLCIYEYACVGEGDNREGIFKPRVIKLTLLYRISNSLYLLSFNRMFLYALCM